MFVLTNKQMREADAYTIDGLGVESGVLMRRAGEALANTAQTLAPIGKILCVCGGGNNGGDGFVCARALKISGRDVDVVCFAARTSKECEESKLAYLSAGGRVCSHFPNESYSLVIDCLLGTGFSGRLKTEYCEAIKRINEYGKNGAKILSADIPSGVNGDNGKVEEVAVRATQTLCIGERKAGVYLGDGIDFAGEVLCVDIGIALPQTEYARLITKKDAQEALPKRKRNTHKGNYGKAAIVAGSEQYSGAAWLSFAACLRSGAGYTTLFTPKTLLTQFMLKQPEGLLVATNDGGRYAFNQEIMQTLLGYSSVAYGMGMGVDEEVARGAEYLLKEYQGTLILDADGLNALVEYRKEQLSQLFKTKKCGVVLTPHVKEFSRLTGENVQVILENGLSAPYAFAKEHGVTVLLKNAVTLVCDGERTALNVHGSAGQAKGGSGDVLSGVIAGLCAQGLSPFTGGCMGAYLTGVAAEIAERKKGEYAMLPRDVIECLPEAFLDLRK